MRPYGRRDKNTHNLHNERCAVCYGHNVKDPVTKRVYTVDKLSKARDRRANGRAAREGAMESDAEADLAMAERYWDAAFRATFVASGVPEEGLVHMRTYYAEGAIANPEAMKVIREWSAKEDS
jgi:hypothetical protein